MSSDALSFPSNINSHIENELNSRANTGFIGQITLLGLTTLFIGKDFYIFPELLVSGLGIFVFSALRIALAKFKITDHFKWHLLYSFIIIMNAFSWAAICYYNNSFNPNKPDHFIFSYFLVAGIVSAANYSLSPSRLLFTLFVLGVSVGAFLPLLAPEVSEELRTSIFLILICYLAFTIKNGFISHFEWRMKINQQLSMINSAKLAALGEMAGGIAHEINNPLSVIDGRARQLIQHISRQSFSAEIGQRDLNTIVSMTDRISKIVKGLKSFSRPGEKDPYQLTSLSLIVTNVIALASDKLKNHQIEIKLNLSENVAIPCRSVQIEQVLLNLLNNSCDAISTLPEKWIAIDVGSQNKKIQLSVTDSGKGISPDIVEKIMQPFFTTKKAGHGTGLGLSISKGLIEDHNGILYYDSLSAHTRFIIEIPINPLDSNSAIN